MCGGRQTVTNTNTNTQWRTVHDVARRPSLFITADEVTEVTPRNPSACQHVTNTRTWETDYWTHFRFYTSAKSNITLHNDGLSSILWSIKVFILQHLDNFCHRSELPPPPMMRRNLRCLSEHDRTAVLQLFFLSLAYYVVPVDKVGLTHTHTHRKTCFQLLFLLTERWETQREIVKTVEMPHHFTLLVFLTMSDIVFRCYFNIFAIILCCSWQVPSSSFFPFLEHWQMKEGLLT